MDRIWQWAWDRCRTRYSWAIYAVSLAELLPVYLFFALLIVAFEKSDRYLEAAALTVGIVPVMMYVTNLPGLGATRLVERWAAGREVDRARALEATYAWSRTAGPRGVAANAAFIAVLFLLVGAIAGGTGSRLVQYGILGAATGISVVLIAVHSYPEGALRPARVALAGDTGMGEILPRSRPTFAAWSNLTVLAAAFIFAVAGAMFAVAIDRVREVPVLVVVIACGLVLFFAVPITVGASFSPSLQPLRDLAEGTERVAAGDYSQRLPVVQDDDLGALSASFNRMQAGLAERQRLHAAFGTYVDPALAARLLEQGDDVFTGDRRQVTVMFVDIRDFTPFAEANTAEDTVARLNALFEIVVPAVVAAGGHVNKFLGDGALAVFGAPNDLANHADAAVSAAALIHRGVAERFGGTLRIGIGINTGVVIAGTIGGGGKLEFTLIGDTVNVAARVEQLTKTTGDAILLTEQSVNAMGSRPPALIDRGSHALKGKSAAVQVFGLGQEASARVDSTG
ncbi:MULTISPECIES: adenylate/guanylate cyclase domain-containing protein [unclassified Mycobacterium]|uniref:adenylate/guanylate cyclase domain-containing protein n=1 Tax=unclassified Mycobacterium TaxID=2642494 RepID=UPI00080214FB|nr:MULTISPECIES: adenylate/guanylate cyclase domain-containing protein [unclassified Mycobacterium]OBB64230.1 cyclase [Mycobacterium sp. 852014-50255_SCH5639931]OBB84304.1 cyclase [Mycobacterium sp. 852002-30065_SCH5024008]